MKVVSKVRRDASHLIKVVALLYLKKSLIQLLINETFAWHHRKYNYYFYTIIYDQWTGLLQFTNKFFEEKMIERLLDSYKILGRLLRGISFLNAKYHLQWVVFQTEWIYLELWKIRKRVWNITLPCWTG